MTLSDNTTREDQLLQHPNAHPTRLRHQEGKSKGGDLRTNHIGDPSRLLPSTEHKLGVALQRDRETTQT